MFSLTIIVDFEAAHCIRDYPGKCSRLHGHNWKVEANVVGPKLNGLGMLIDFHDLKAEVNQVLAKLDHFYLNEVEEFQVINPTAENIAKYIYQELVNRSAFSGDVKVRSIKVWESPHSAVEYMQEESACHEG